MDDIDKLYIELDVNEKLIQILSESLNDLNKTLSTITIMKDTNTDINKNIPVFSWELNYKYEKNKPDFTLINDHFN
jgi:hypothetical protein